MSPVRRSRVRWWIAGGGLVALTAGCGSPPAGSTAVGAIVDPRAVAPVDPATAAASASATVATAPTTTPAPPVRPEGSASCPPSGHAAVVDRDSQRGWLCTDGVAGPKFPITTAISQPDPGTYEVYGRDRMTTSDFGGHTSYLDNFVAFSYGKNTGARIAFHAVPRDADGNPYQPYDELGDPDWFGDSSGCIRVMPDESERIWDHLADGDPVVVIT
jgi:hypothetical protein